MLQFSFARGQSLTNLTQRMGSCKLAEQHGDKLSPTGEPPSVPLTMMIFNELLKLGSGEDSQKLTENAAYSIQGDTSSFGCLVLAELHNLTEVSPFISNC